MKTILSLLMLLGPISTSNLYSIQIRLVDDTLLSISSYEGKKIMIVNIATGGQLSNQLQMLQEVYESNKDSLVIIGVPSNTFGNERRNNGEIASYCDSIGITFPIAAKTTIVGSDAHSLYQWLTKQSLNDAFNSEVKSDFQKYLISRSGQLIGVFPGTSLPSHPGIVHAINN